MGLLTEECNAAGANLTREEQDEFAAQSHQKAAKAWKNGLFDDEVVPVPVPQRKGDPVMFTEDEGIRGDATAEGMAKLPAAFNKEGTVTAGSSSQISDGACAVVVMSSAKARGAGSVLAGRNRRPRPGCRTRLHPSWVLDDLGQPPASVKTMRRTLTRYVGRGYRDQIATACFAHALPAGDVSLVLYDVTTLYFEAENAESRPDHDHSVPCTTVFTRHAAS